MISNHILCVLDSPAFSSAKHKSTVSKMSYSEIWHIHSRQDSKNGFFLGIDKDGSWNSMISAHISRQIFANIGMCRFQLFFCQKEPHFLIVNHFQPKSCIKKWANNPIQWPILPKDLQKKQPVCPVVLCSGLRFAHKLGTTNRKECFWYTILTS